MLVKDKNKGHMVKEYEEEYCLSYFVLLCAERTVVNSIVNDLITKTHQYHDSIPLYAPLKRRIHNKWCTAYNFFGSLCGPITSVFEKVNALLTLTIIR